MKRLIEKYQKAINTETQMSGIFIKQYPEEEQFYEQLKNKFKQYIKKEPIKDIKTKRRDVMHPLDFEYISNNFVGLYNLRESPKMKLIREGMMEKTIINKNIVDYKITFFVEFPERKSYYGYEIAINVQRNAMDKSFTLEPNMTNVELKGALGLSDLTFGVVNRNLDNQKNIRFYKDTNKFGEYLFMPSDSETKNTLKAKGAILEENQQRANASIKNSGPKVIQGRFQRGEPPQKPKFVPQRIYTQPSKNIGKLRIGGQCIGESLANKSRLLPKNCDNSLTFEYKNDQLKTKDGCLSFHRDGKIELVPCDSLDTCKPNEEGNCKKFKFIKYGGLEIMGKNNCLNIDNSSFVQEPCDMSARSDIS